MSLEITFRCLALKANCKLAYRFVGVPDQGMKSSTFNKFELGRPDMDADMEASLNVLGYTNIFSKVNASFPTAVRKAPLIALSSLVSLVSI